MATDSSGNWINNPGADARADLTARYDAAIIEGATKINSFPYAFSGTTSEFFALSRIPGTAKYDVVIPGTEGLRKTALWAFTPGRNFTLDSVTIIETSGSAPAHVQVFDSSEAGADQTTSGLLVAAVGAPAGDTRVIKPAFDIQADGVYVEVTGTCLYVVQVSDGTSLCEFNSCLGEFVQATTVRT